MSTPALTSVSDQRSRSSAPPKPALRRALLAALAAAACFAVACAYAFLAPAEYESRAFIRVQVPEAVEAKMPPPKEARFELTKLLRSEKIPERVKALKPAELASLNSKIGLATFDSKTFEVSLTLDEAQAVTAACNRIASYAAVLINEFYPPGTTTEVVPATVPDGPSWPNRTLILLVGGALSFVVGSLILLSQPRSAAASVRPSSRDSEAVPASSKSPRTAGQEHLPSPRDAWRRRQSTTMQAVDAEAPKGAPGVGLQSTDPAFAGASESRSAGEAEAESSVPPFAAGTSHPGQPGAAAGPRPEQRARTQMFGSPLPPPPELTPPGPAPVKVMPCKAEWQAQPGLEPERRAELCDAILATEGAGCLVVAFTSSPRFALEKSQVLVETGLILAQVNEPRILLIEADFLGARLQRWLNLSVPWTAGFSQQLQTRAFESDQPWQVLDCLPTLHVLAEGALRSPGAILSHQFESCVRGLRSLYDFILIDGPLLSADVDCQALNEVSDAVVVVTRAGDAHGRSDDVRLARFTKKQFLREEDY